MGLKQHHRRNWYQYHNQVNRREEMKKWPQMSGILFFLSTLQNISSRRGKKDSWNCSARRKLNCGFSYAEYAFCTTWEISQACRSPLRFIRIMAWEKRLDYPQACVFRKLGSASCWWVTLLTYLELKGFQGWILWLT